MNALDQLPRASFGGIQFPVRKVSVTGGLRDHVHEYPKTPGGSPEKLGRKLYVIKMTAPFFNVFPTYGPGLYPGKLADLVERFEQALTQDLLVPQIGTIRAYCINWTRDLEAKIRSGEVAELEFREDQASAFLVENLINIQAKDLSVVAESMFSEADGLGVGDLFGGLQSAIGSITGLVDLVELYGALAMSKLDSILSLFSFLDVTVVALQDAENQAFIESFLASWRAAIDLRENLLKVSSPIVDYTVPTLMAIADVSRVLYGDASAAGDLLSLNALPDAFHIKAGTKMRVWAKYVEAA